VAKDESTRKFSLAAKVTSTDGVKTYYSRTYAGAAAAAALDGGAAGW